MRSQADPTRFGVLAAMFALALASCNERDAASSAAPAAQDSDGQVAADRSSGGTPRPLPARWYVDTDGNAVPDFVEAEAGFDPRRDDCPLAPACGAGEAGAKLDLRSDVLVILDSSGSMAARQGGATKLEHAKRSVRTFFEGRPAAVRAGFMVYGHEGSNTQSGKAASCAGVDVLHPIGTALRDDVDAALDSFDPVGWTPIARALDTAIAQFGPDASSDKRVVLVSDGIETCEGDPIAAARKLANAGVSVDVIGFGVSPSEGNRLRSIATAGGGDYFSAATHDQLDAYFRKQMAAFEKTIGASNCEMARNNEAFLCDAKLELAAVAAINAQSRAARAAGDMKSADAYTMLRVRVTDAFAQRRAALASVRARAEALRRQAFATNTDTLAAFDQLSRGEVARSIKPLPERGQVTVECAGGRYEARLSPESIVLTLPSGQRRTLVRSSRSAEPEEPWLFTDGAWSVRQELEGRYGPRLLVRRGDGGFSPCRTL